MPILSLRASCMLLVGLLASADAFAQVTPRRGGAVRPRAATQLQQPSSGGIAGYDRGTVRTLAVSGTTGDHLETILAPGNGWLYGIEMGERQDQPCYLGIWAVEGAAPAPGFPIAFDRCDGDVNDNSVAALGFASARSEQEWNAARRVATGLLIGIPIYSEIRLIGALFDRSDPTPPVPIMNGQPVALDGVGICQNNSNDEMKGLRIHGSKMTLDGGQIQTTPIVTTSSQAIAGYTIPAGTRVNEEFRRPNCSNNNDGWQTIRTCAANEVLVGLDVHYKFPGFGGNQDRARITGLAPKCAPISIRRG